MQEKRKLEFGLNPVGFPGKPHLLWNRDDLIKVMKAIVEAKNQRIALEKDLVGKVGRKKFIH